jgi:polyribonucleotide nucleotidyltransferase
VRVARIDGQFQINPKTSDLKRADMDLIVGATADSVAMVEGEMHEVSEEEMVAAIAFGHEAIKAQVQLQKDLAEAVGRTPESQPREYPKYEENEELKQRIHEGVYQSAYEVARSGNTSKSGRKEGFSQVKKAFLDQLVAEQPELDMKHFSRYYSSAEKKAIRDMMVKERVRLDGRQLTEIRPIWSEINYLPGAHGSAIFTRGETQSLTTATLGTKLDEQIVDQPLTKGFSKFMLHYNFPGFSTGEVKPNRGAGRREIGHGNLAMRSLKQVLPPDEENPYTIRIVSDILESNGSSSMATVCAGSLALMDAGVKVRAAVAGIAMGLVQDKETGEYAVLSDILGDEDHLGDMDFKVTGTEKGICACQMDIKIQGLSNEILTAALHQAREGRLHILREMAKTIAAPAPELKAHTPRSHKMLIDKEFIGAVIGPGGKVIQQIQKDTNATVIIEEKDEKGHVSIYAANQADMQGAIDRIRAIAAQPEVGETYKGKVRSIQPYGAFVEIMPGKDGLLHISEVTHERIASLEGVLEVGQEIDVKLVDIDKKTGKYRLSRKVLLEKQA